MKSLIKTVMLLSVYHVAKSATENIEAQMRKEEKDENKYKRKMLVVGVVHTLLGVIYND